MPPERISKVLAAAGVASRRGADALVAAGRVRVDGRPASSASGSTRAARPIDVDGAAAARPPATRPPRAPQAGRRDLDGARPACRATVVDLVPRRSSRRRAALPGGPARPGLRGPDPADQRRRLGGAVLHPRYGVEREYAVALARLLNTDQAERARGRRRARGGHRDASTACGRRRAPRTAASTTCSRRRPTARLVWYRATLHQGWKRQLRRMFAQRRRPRRTPGSRPHRAAAPRGSRIGRVARPDPRRGAPPACAGHRDGQTRRSAAPCALDSAHARSRPGVPRLDRRARRARPRRARAASARPPRSSLSYRFVTPVCSTAR